MDSAQQRGLGFLAQRPKTINMTQNQKINNEDQKRRKHLNLHKNMMNTRIKPKN
jgi:hypothetical protein